MNREFLKEKGLNDEQIEAVMKAYGQSVNDIKEKADKVEGLESQIEDLQGQLKERDTQLEDLGKKAKDSEELTSEIDRLKQENENATQELKDKLSKQAFEFTLEKSLGKAGAKNPKAVKALLDTDSIKLDGETLLGLDDQLKALQESDGYLFGEEEPAGLKGRKPHETSAIGGNGAITKETIMKEPNNTKRQQLIRENSHLFQ